jgi:hypothetical protein
MKLAAYKTIFDKWILEIKNKGPNQFKLKKQVEKAFDKWYAANR